MPRRAATASSCPSRRRHGHDRAVLMTYVVGTPWTTGGDPRSGPRRRGDRRVTVRAWFHGALLHGLFHRDVHAGNLMVAQPATSASSTSASPDGSTTAPAPSFSGAPCPRSSSTATSSAVVRRPSSPSARSAGRVDVDQAVADVETLLAPLVEQAARRDHATARCSTHVLAGGHRLPRPACPASSWRSCKQLLYFERYAKDLAPGYEMFNDAAIVEPDPRGARILRRLRTRPQAEGGWPRHAPPRGTRRRSRSGFAGRRKAPAEAQAGAGMDGGRFERSEARE